MIIIAFALISEVKMRRNVIFQLQCQFINILGIIVGLFFAREVSKPYTSVETHLAQGYWNRISSIQAMIDDILINGKWKITAGREKIEYRAANDLSSPKQCINSSHVHANKYAWAPNNFHNISFNLDRRDICKAVNGRNIVFAGDSITNNMFHTYFFL